MTSFTIFGAGSIGCYIGGRLQLAGHAVRFIGRPRLADLLARDGLSLSDYQGRHSHLAASVLDVHTGSHAPINTDVVLVTVKSADTTEAARTLATHLQPGQVVISLQNGLHNADCLSAALPDHTVLAGMVPFNVAQTAPGHFHQGTEGRLAVQAHPALSRCRSAFADAGLPLDEHADMKAVQWAKLLLNLNNAVNALSGLPLKAELEQRDYRRVLAAAQAEAISLLNMKQQHLARLTPLPARWLPALLGVPDKVFRIAAKKMLAIDPLARSSMQDDLAAGRRTEIAVLQGEVVALAKTLGRSAPVNATLMALVEAAENGDHRRFGATELRQIVLGY